MPRLAANTSQIARWRPWHALALLVVAYSGFNALLNPMRGRGDDIPAVLRVGVFFIQPVLFAMWTAMGPPPAMKRIPFSLAGFVCVVFAACVPQFLSANYFPSSRVGPEWLIMPGALFAAALIVVLAVRTLTRWSIANMHVTEVRASPVHQFSIRYLLVLTAICAVLLGIGRWLAIDWSFDSTWRSIGRMVARIWLILLVLIPAILVPLTVISPRPMLRMFLGMIISGAVLAWVAIETIVFLDYPPRSEVTRQVLCIQLGAMLASIMSALVVRFAGYRLIRTSTLATAADHQSAVSGL